MLLRHRFLEFLRRRLGRDPPPLRLIFPDGESFDFTPNPTVTLAFHSRDSIKALLVLRFNQFERI